MKKTMYLLLSAVLFPLLTMAQAEEGTIKVGKDEKKGFIAKSKYDKELVEAALAGKLSEAGVTKWSKKKKFYTCKEVTVPAISPTKVDLYYKVTGKKHKSKIFFIVSKGYDNYVTSATDATTAANVNTFLAQVDATVEHNEEIRRKEQEVKQMHEKMEKEKADVKRAEDEKRKSEKELEDMKKKK